MLSTKQAAWDSSQEREEEVVTQMRNSKTGFKQLYLRVEKGSGLEEWSGLVFQDWQLLHECLDYSTTFPSRAGKVVVKHIHWGMCGLCDITYGMEYVQVWNHEPVVLHSWEGVERMMLVLVS